MALGYYDADGIWHHGEDDFAAPSGRITDELNKGLGSVARAVTREGGLVDKRIAQDPTVAESAARLAQSDVGLLRGEDIPGSAFEIGAEPGEAPYFRVTETGGVVSKITHQTNSVPLSAVISLEELPVESSWDLVLVGDNERVIWGRRQDGTEYPSDSTGPEAPMIFDAVGDSTTFGAGLTDSDAIPRADTWPVKLSTRIGRAVNNWGASGARAEEIASRLGGINPTATIPGGVIPASGTVALESMDILPLRGSNITEYAAALVTAQGVRVPGTLRRVSATAHSFTRLDPGAAVPAPGRVEVASVFGAEVRSRRLILGMGINNEPLIVSGAQTLADVKRWYTAATSGLAHRPLVWGVLDRGPSEAAGTKIGDFIRALEPWLAETYGADWSPLRQYLASERALSDALLYQPGFSPTDDDRAAVALNTVPPSYRVAPGSVHLSALGHSLQAGYFGNHLTTKGLL